MGAPTLGFFMPTLRHALKWALGGAFSQQKNRIEEGDLDWGKVSLNVRPDSYGGGFFFLKFSIY